MGTCSVAFRADDKKMRSILWRYYLRSHLSLIAQMLIAVGTALIVCLYFFSETDRFYLNILLMSMVVAEAGLLTGTRIVASYGAQINHQLLTDETVVVFSENGFSQKTAASSIDFTWRDVAQMRLLTRLVEIKLRQYPTLYFPLDLFSIEQRELLAKYIARHGLKRHRMLPPAVLAPVPAEEYENAVSVSRFVRTSHDVYRFNLYYFFRCLHVLIYDFFLLAVIAGFSIWMYMSGITMLWPLTTLGILLVGLNVVAVLASWLGSKRSGGQNCEIILSEDVFVFRDFHGTGRLHWSNIPAARVTRGYIFLFITSQGAVILPRPALDEAAIELLESKIVKYRLDERKLKMMSVD